MTRQLHPFLGMGLLAIAAALTGCGDDAGGGMDAGSHDGHPHEDAGGYTVVPCEDVGELFSGEVAKGEDDRYQVLVIETSPSPPRKGKSTWVVEIQDTTGDAADDVDVMAVKPYMPAHNHTGVVIPIIEATDDPGRYEVSDINLWMSGPWTVTFDLKGPDGDDEAVFDVCAKE